MRIGSSIRESIRVLAAGPILVQARRIMEMESRVGGRIPGFRVRALLPAKKWIPVRTGLGIIGFRV